VRHVRMLGLCLVAALAVCAYAVSSASALPEWGKCENVGSGGNYKNSNCTEKAKPKGSGSYEWKKGSELAPVPFTGQNVGSGGVLYSEFAECLGETYEEYYHEARYTRQACEGKNPPKSYRHHEGYPYIECTEENSSGAASGKNEVTGVHVTFKGCKALGALPCENAGPEEIQTSELKGKLGYISKPNKEVGVLLEPVKKHGAFAEFTCPGLPLSVVVGVGNKKEGAAHTSSGCDQECRGATPEEEKHGGYDGVISPITPVNQMTSTYTQEYKVENVETNEACPENTPSHFERKHIDLLENAPEITESGIGPIKFQWGCAGEEITNVNTPAEPGEIKA
jgi:hypothetical protein